MGWIPWWHETAANLARGRPSCRGVATAVGADGVTAAGTTMSPSVPSQMQ